MSNTVTIELDKELAISTLKDFRKAAEAFDKLRTMNEGNNKRISNLSKLIDAFEQATGEGSWLK